MKDEDCWVCNPHKFQATHPDDDENTIHLVNEDDEVVGIVHRKIMSRSSFLEKYPEANTPNEAPVPVYEFYYNENGRRITLSDPGEVLSDELEE